MALDYCLSQVPRLGLSWALAAAVLLAGIIAIRQSVARHKKQRPPRRGSTDGASCATMRALKDMYFKLHNLEHHPEVLPAAKELLLSLLSRTLAEAGKHRRGSILAVDEYTPEKLGEFLRERREGISQQWSEYLDRRAGGAQRELVPTAEAARRWLEGQAPLRLVDGAWLGHVHRATAPFALRPVTTASWLVLSEELGDGSPERNHVHVYGRLLDQVGVRLPPPHSRDFGRSVAHAPVGVWRAAVGQLLVSLFPHDFLPEVLGFSLHFEEATVETLQAAKELRELRLDARYFLLHLCIDNAASGHAAMAQQIVANHLEHVRKDGGPAAAQATWRRVQAGFVLSEHVANLEDSGQGQQQARPFPRSTIEAQLLRIMQDKARASHGTHGASQARIGRRRLAEWLDPALLGSSTDWQRSFLDALAGSAAWVRRGVPDDSPLLRELAWGGKMFGAFTQRETAVVRRWIESLAPAGAAYYDFTGRPAPPSSSSPQIPGDVTAEYPVFAPLNVHERDWAVAPLPAGCDICHCPPLRLVRGSSARAAMLMPLWFAHTALLDSFLAVPARTTTAVAAAVLRCTRAQLGFGVGGSGVAGTDEVRAEGRTGIVELGLEICTVLGVARPRSIQDALHTWPHDGAVQMLHLALRPISYGAVLIGMARAFVDMHQAVACLGLLARESQRRLESIAETEKASLSDAVEHLRNDSSEAEQAVRGYLWARRHVEECFEAPVR